MLIALCCNNSKSKKENEIKDKLKNAFLFSLIVVVEGNKLLFFFKKYDACAVGAPYFF